MKSKFKLGLAVIGIFLAASFWPPSLPLAHAKTPDWGQLKNQLKKVNDFKELKLGPEKEKAWLHLLGMRRKLKN
jgi:hypothetical protein